MPKQTGFPTTLPNGQLQKAVRSMRNCVGNFGEPIVYRKLNGILNALGMQVEDDIYSSSGVVRLCEALLATAELYELPIEGAEELEKLTIAVIQFVTIRH